MSDSLNPNVATVVDPDGNVSYDFEGHIHALGLDLDAGDTTTPPADHKLRWLKNSVSIAELLGSFITGNQSHVAMRATPPGSGYAAITATAAESGSGVVNVATTNAYRALLTGDGRSDWLQLVNTEKLALQNGHVTGLTIAANADLDYQIALPVGWQEHLAFFASAWPDNSWNGFSTRSPGNVFSASRGVVHVANGSTAQTFHVRWLSLGRP
jgi:hypothetical protein